MYPFMWPLQIGDEDMLQLLGRAIEDADVVVDAPERTMRCLCSGAASSAGSAAACCHCPCCTNNTSMLSRTCHSDALSWCNTNSIRYSPVLGGLHLL